MPKQADTVVQRLVVLQILEQREATQADLRAVLSDIEPAAISKALRTLAAENVAHVDHNRIVASPCLRHLDSLGLVSL